MPTLYSGAEMSTEMVPSPPSPRHKVEQIQSQGYYEVVTGGDTRTVGGMTFTRAWVVTPDSPIAGLRDVQVSVSWTDQDGTHTVSTRTLKGL